MRIFFLIMSSLFMNGCSSGNLTHFEKDLNHLNKSVETIILTEGKSYVAVVPEYQARVMTSSSDGKNSFGWMNYDVISEGVLNESESKGKMQSHIHQFGGEERFWIGPEGGQFSIFFKKGKEFSFDNWKTPSPIDTESFNLKRKTDKRAEFFHKFSLENYNGKIFEVEVERNIEILSKDDISKILDENLNDKVSFVGYKTENKLKNIGNDSWSKDSGLLSIWLLGVFKHSDNTTVVIPIKNGNDDEYGVKVIDDYFGKIPSNRISVTEETIFFRADGKMRGKLGVTPKRAKGIAGSYNSDDKVLTLVTYSRDPKEKLYVNSQWKWQKEPYSGDEINAYNDGPVDDSGKQIGPFYEIESSSPAKELKSGEFISHIQSTMHLQCDDETVLDQIARKKLGVGIDDIKRAFE